MKVIGNLQILGQKSIIKMNNTPTAELEYSGWVSNEFIAENVNAGDLLYFEANTTRSWYKADNSNVNRMPARAIALETAEAGSRILMLRYGTFRIADALTPYLNFTNSYIYVGTLGNMSATKPALADTYVQRIGTPVDHNVGWFDFNSTLTKIDSSLNESLYTY